MGFPTVLFLDILLALAFLSSILGAAVLRLPSGPEGPVGGWLLLIPTCGLAGFLLFQLASRGLVETPGGRAVQFAAGAGILTTLVAAFVFSLDSKGGALSVASSLVPYVIFLGCLAAIHGKSFPDPAIGSLVMKVCLGITALAGWALLGAGLIQYVHSDLQASTARALQEDAREKEYESSEVAEYRSLPADAPLHVVMRFTWSRNGAVKKEARERVQNWPALDDKLIELLNEKNETVITYVSHVHDAPPAKLAPAWGAMMDFQLKSWDVLQYDQYAGKWEPNLSSYFEGAAKIQKAGGNLKPQLNAWYVFLKKCKGMGNLAAFVKTLL